MDADRLPGGLGVWAGRRFLFRYRCRVRGRVLGRTAYWGVVLVAAAAAWVSYTDAALRSIVLLLTGVVILRSLPNRHHRWGAPVTAETQPALHQLVEGVARRLDAPMPGRVWLTSSGPPVRLFLDGRRRMLRIHLAVVSCVTRAQLEALVAHELAPLRYPRQRLVLRLRAACLGELGVRERRRRRAERNLARLSDFWSTVEHDCDAAATTFAGPDEAARALVAGELASVEYLAFALDQESPKRRTEAVQDLEDGWPHFVGHGDAPPTVDDDHPDEARFHRTLAGPIGRVGQLHLRLPADRVELAPIDEKDQRRLAVITLLLVGRSEPRWYTFATAPPQWWVARARDDADLVRGWAETTDDTELLEKLVRGADERPFWWHRYAEYRLLAAGWRLEHPAVRGVLVDRAGEQVDITRMDPEAVRALIVPTLVA